MRPVDLERALPAFDDLQLPAVLAQQVARELATLVSGVSDDCANVREQWPQASEQQGSRLSVGDVSWLHSACDQQPEGVHQNVALAAFHALVRSNPRMPPRSVVFTD